MFPMTLLAGRGVGSTPCQGYSMNTLHKFFLRIIMTISADAANLAAALATATPMTGRLKDRQDRSDFGGEDSYLLKVRRIGRDYPCGDDVQDGDFGFYLGFHEGSFVVALQAIFPPRIISYERFETQEQLKALWELD